MSALNYDGSRDYGCLQINDKAHAAFIQSGKWSDPAENAAYGYTIYRQRLAVDGIGWTAWYAVAGVLY